MGSKSNLILILGRLCLKSRNPFGRSANGAKYDSQGQARSASPLVIGNQLKRALKVRNIFAIIALFQSFTVVYAWTQGRRASLCSALARGPRGDASLCSALARGPRGDAPRSARRLPLAIIFRAFGAPQTNFRLLRQSLLGLAPRLYASACFAGSDGTSSAKRFLHELKTTFHRKLTASHKVVVNVHAWY